MENIIDRHAKKIQAILSCFDRIILTGTIPGICYADGMSTLLRTKGIRIFDYTKWAEPLREEIRTNAEQLIQVSYISSRQWNLVMLTSPGIIRRPTKPISRQLAANVCIITSTSLCLIWVCVI